MSRHTQRLARLERIAQAKAAKPYRLFVMWPGDPEPPDLGPHDVVIMVTYESPAEVERPAGAGVVVMMPDNGRGDMPPGGRYV